MDTWHNSAIEITSNTLYSEQYCLEYNWDQCSHWLTYYPEQTLNTYMRETQQWNSNTLVFILVLVLLIRLVKWILKLILPKVWKR